MMLLTSRCCPMDLKNVETKLSGANANQGSFDMVIAAATFSWSPTAHLAIRRWTRRRLAPARAYQDEVRPGSRSVLSKPFPSSPPASSAWPAPTEIRQAYQPWNNWYLGPYICRYGKHQIPTQPNHLGTQFRYYNFCLLPSLNFGWTNL